MSTIELLMETITKDTWTVLSVSGEVDLNTASQLKERIITLLDQGQRQLVVDLDRVDFIDSTGLSALVSGLKRTKEQDGELTVVCTRPAVLRLLSLTGLDQVLQVRETVEQATVPS